MMIQFICWILGIGCFLLILLIFVDSMFTCSHLPHGWWIMLGLLLFGITFLNYANTGQWWFMNLNLNYWPPPGDI